MKMSVVVSKSGGCFSSFLSTLFNAEFLEVRIKLHFESNEQVRQFESSLVKGALSSNILNKKLPVGPMLFEKTSFEKNLTPESDAMRRQPSGECVFHIQLNDVRRHPTLADKFDAIPNQTPYAWFINGMLSTLRTQRTENLFIGNDHRESKKSRITTIEFDSAVAPGNVKSIRHFIEALVVTPATQRVPVLEQESELGF